jgi:hypothetical protein
MQKLVLPDPKHQIDDDPLIGMQGANTELPT